MEGKLWVIILHLHRGKWNIWKVSTVHEMRPCRHMRRKTAMRFVSANHGTTSSGRLMRMMWTWFCTARFITVIRIKRRFFLFIETMISQDARSTFSLFPKLRERSDERCVWISIWSRRSRSRMIWDIRRSGIRESIFWVNVMRRRQETLPACRAIFITMSTAPTFFTIFWTTALLYRL